MGKFGKKKTACFWENGVIALAYAVYGYFCAVLFFRQSVRYNGKYMSDLPAHIDSGINGDGYSLIESMMAGIVRHTQMYKAVGIFLALLVLGTIFVTWLILKKMAPDVNPILLHVGAFLCNMVMAIYLPVFNDHRYLGVQSGNIYHNSTYTGMRFLGMIVLYLYVVYNEKYEKGLSKEQWILFAESLILVNLVKPNFFVAFAPAMGIYLLIDLWRNKCRTFPQIFKFGLAVIPSAVVLLFVYVMLFPGGDGEGMVIDPGYCFF